MNLIVDTAEKNPLLFSIYQDMKIYHDSLPCGDYTMVGYDMPNDEESVIFERKADCQELVTNLGKKWKQFEAVMQLMSQYKHKAIIVCGPDNFQYLYTRGFTQLHPNFVYKRLAYLQVQYNVPTIFLQDRDTAENYMMRVFIEILRKNREDHGE